MSLFKTFSYITKQLISVPSGNIDSRVKQNYFPLEQTTELYYISGDRAHHQAILCYWTKQSQKHGRYWLLLTRLVPIDHGIAADQGSFEPATTLQPPGF